jgi:hypothetical protein
MTVGFGIFLIVVGAIIKYALNVDVAGVEENTIGWILIVAGAIVAVLGLITATANPRANDGPRARGRG